MVIEAVKKVIETAAEHLDVGTVGSGNAEKPVHLFDNALDGFRNGACLDLRVRVAIDMLTHSPMFGAWEGTAKGAALHALEASTELLNLAESRGLIEPFDSAASEERLKAHVSRQVAYQLEQEKEGKRQQDQSVQVGRHVASALNRNN